MVVSNEGKKINYMKGLKIIYLYKYLELVKILNGDVLKLLTKLYQFAEKKKIMVKELA